MNINLELFREIIMEISQELAEFLAQSKNSVDVVVEFVKKVNADRRKFEFTGKVENESMPCLVLFNEVIEGNLDLVVLVQINEYLARVNRKQDLVFRCEPWVKFGQGFYVEDYKRFDLNGLDFDEGKYFDIPIKFLPVEYNENMLVPKELWMLFNLSFPEISTVFGFMRSNNSTFVVIQSYPYSLSQILPTTSRDQILSIIQQLSSVCAILHSKQVFNFRFSLEKIDIDEFGIIKIFDFSSSILLSEFDVQKPSIQQSDIEHLVFILHLILISSSIRQDDVLFSHISTLQNTNTSDVNLVLSQLLNL